MVEADASFYVCVYNFPKYILEFKNKNNVVLPKTMALWGRHFSCVLPTNALVSKLTEKEIATRTHFGKEHRSLAEDISQMISPSQ